MHKPTCNIRKVCGDRESRYRGVASPDNPYAGGDYWSNYTPFSPSDLDNLILWVEGDLFSAAADTQISVWEDVTENNNDFTQGTSNQQPIFKENILNGRPVLRFDGTNDGMTSSLTLDEPFTIYCVYSYRSSASADRRAVCGSFNWLIGPYQGKHQCFTGTDFIEGPAIVQNEFVLACAVQVDDAPTINTDFYINNVLIGSNTPSAAPVGVRLAASGVFSNPLNGDIAAVLIYQDLHDETQRNQVSNYLNNKYAIY